MVMLHAVNQLNELLVFKTPPKTKSSFQLMYLEKILSKCKLT